MKLALACVAPGEAAQHGMAMADEDGSAAAPINRAAAAAETAARTVAVEGNRLVLLTEGPELLDALLALIDGAKSSLRLLYYIYADDSSGERVRAALLAAQQRGVAVSVLIDGFGSGGTSQEYFAGLREAGAHFCRFHPSYGRRYLLRNHQKLALADDKRVLIGGFNIQDSYFGTVADGAWRDIGLLIEGPAAARLAPYYDALIGWALEKGARFRALRRIIHRYSETDGRLQWQFGAPTRRLSPWAQSVCRDLAHSRDMVMIAAYFAPTGAMLRRIGRAARRGRARIITAARSDNAATVAAARHTYGRLLKRGVEMFEYRPTKLHSKLMVMDDVVHIGSSNFDIRSLYLNLELMLRVDDPAFATLMRLYFEGETEGSLAITPALHRQRAGLANRIRWALSFWLVASADYTVTRRLNFGGE